MFNEREILQQAHGLIKQRQFHQARQVLLKIPQNPIAQKWLSKLDEIAPGDTASVPQSASTASSHADDKPAVNFSSLLRSFVAVFMGIAGVLMILVFVLVPWIDMGETALYQEIAAMEGVSMEEDQGMLEMTPLEIFMGENNGESFSLDLEAEGGGIAHVRFIDRLLIMFPVGGLLILALAYLYAMGNMSRLTCAFLWVVLALALSFFPPVWESASNSEIEDSFSDVDPSMVFGGGENLYEDGYTTGTPLLIGLPALGVAVLALFGELAALSADERTRRAKAIPG